jgi:hypothetical protein
MASSPQGPARRDDTRHTSDRTEVVSSGRGDGRGNGGSRRRRLGVRLGVAGTAVLAAVGITAAVIPDMATSTPVASGSPSTPAPDDRDRTDRPRWQGGPHAGRPFGGGLFGALHGEAVFPKEGGGYQTIATQRGQVTAVSGSSITLRSEDGYQRSYTVNGDTVVNADRGGIDAVKKGEEAAVRATVAGGNAVAIAITDLDMIKERRDRWRKRLPLPTRPN